MRRRCKASTGPERIRAQSNARAMGTNAACATYNAAPTIHTASVVAATMSRRTVPGVLKHPHRRSRGCDI